MSYKNLPDNTRVWVYQSNRALNKKEIDLIKEQGADFLREWSAHGAKLNAAFEIFHNQFIALFVDEAQAKATGCSIDKSVHLIKSFEREFDLTLLDRNLVAYKLDKKIMMNTRDEFLAKFRNSELSADTTIFDNLVSTKREFEAKWEVPLKDSWLFELLEK
jgi:hypothetical protein